MQYAIKSFGFLRRLKVFSFFNAILLSSLLICSGSVMAQSRASFDAYKENIPGSAVNFDMVAVKGGTFSMGSPDTEPGHKPDESPVHEIMVDSFWMGKFEVTWDEYELFIFPELEKQQAAKTNKEVEVDGITRPTPPFTDMSFGMGKSGFPAVNMTYYAALSYCKWLTDRTGHFYRLPTEAEWEYACRAGSAKAYSFGDAEASLEEYAWYDKNSESVYHKPGLKKPNAFNLFDMHGNVAEWTMDQYLPDFYASGAGKTVSNPWAVPSKLYPHTVRGGSWNDAAESLRSAARKASMKKWKRRDPQIPRSAWWMTDASFVGFRIVRPAKQPSPEMIKKYFSAPIEDL